VPLTGKDKFRLKVKGWKMIFQANGAWKQAGVAKLIFDKADFKPKFVRRHKDSHFILIKGTIQQKKTVVNTDTPKAGTSKFIKQTLLDIKVDRPQHISSESLYTPFSPTDRSSRFKKTNKETSELNDTIDYVILPEYSTPKLQNTHLSRQTTELSPKQIIF
jgi:hypothetical protein